ncbi:putative distant relative of homeotic protein bithoraxoid [Methanocella conradii HZ254]|uniref:Distant relative of homeotic protein bithoraxoid n=1 Tax=Methanocella conradii (strain DSM 24694 / JCM 17849 / CGMCC 1.5162 / HZ254) TaxID=1041930 RepID=H8I556_METCZ|nr:roadblock/LC7 domain-containing protein [Methanocella conradii]AFC99253.1 putative distant relative of homeotic protein bithoraxoid [Methanocella conradii HZ254]
MDMHKEAAISGEKVELLKAALSKLRSLGIEKSAVISRDGTMLAADVPPGEEHKIYAAMYAAMLGSAEGAASELRLGVPKRVVMDVGKKKVIVEGAGPMALIVALVGSAAQYQKAAPDIDRAASEVKAIMAK